MIRSMKRVISLGLLLTSVLGARATQGGSVYQYAFDQTNYQVDLGSSVTVNVYLQEQVSGNTPSVLATDGLIGTGVRVSFDLSPMPSSPANVLTVGDIFPNEVNHGFSGFQSVGLVKNSYADLAEAVDITSLPVLADNLGNGLFRIFLGAFQFTAGSIAGQTTLIQAASIPTPGVSYSVTGAGDDLDDQIATASAQIQVGTGAVPEPSSIIAMTLGVVGIAAHKFLRLYRKTSSI